MKIKESEIKEIIRQVLNEVSSSDIKELEAIVKELQGASKMHKGQSEQLAAASKMHKSQSERIDKIVKSVSKTEGKLTEKATGQYKVSPKVQMHWGMDKVVIISGNKRVVLNRKEMKSLMKGVKANKLTEEKLTEKKQLYVVASTNGTLFSGDKGVTEKQALKIMDRYEKVGMNLFMLGVQYWNKPHKYNKKKIMVGEGGL